MPGISVIGPIADERTVLAHGSDLRPAWWQERTPGGWSNFLSALPASSRGRGYHRITRNDLLSRNTVGGSSSTLLVACYAWGTGDSGFLVPRRARVFRDTPPDELVDHLDAARRLLTAQGPGAAYESLHDGGANRIKHMRASFFTKVLYAADSRPGAQPGGALILDQFVALALKDIDGWAIPSTGGWSPETYDRWLTHARDIAEQQSTDERQVRVDAVEMAYFEHGRVIARRRRAAMPRPSRRRTR
jgi:hypothetical protein